MRICRSGVVAAFSMIAVAFTSSALGQDAWRAMTGSADRGFTAEMPAAPKYTAVPMKTKSGSAYTMHQYQLDQGAVAYVAQTAIYPQDVSIVNPQANLKGGLDNSAKNMDGGKWANINWVKHQGLTAVDAVGVRGGHAIRSYSVMKGRQIFTLTYAGPTGTARSANAQRFISSLRFPPAPASKPKRN